MACRIAFVVGQLIAGGLERQLYYVLSGMDRQRFQPTVFVWNFNESDPFVTPIRSLDVPLYPVSGTSPISKTMALRASLRTLEPEVAHSYSTFTNFSTWLATRGTRTVPIGSIRNVFELATQSGGWRGLLNARYPRSQIFNSHAAATSAQKTKGPFRPAEILTVCNGMDVDAFRVAKPPSDSTPLLLGIGSLNRKKRWDRMLSVCAQLVVEGRDFRFHLAGEGPLKDELGDQVASLRLGDRVRFLGRQSDINQLLAEASALVLTSEIEGTPNVVMEAMACGRPVVAMDAGDVSRVVHHDESGFVCPNGDESKFAEYVARLLDDGDLRRRMGLRGREIAERDFGLDRLVANTLDAYCQAGWRG